MTVGRLLTGAAVLSVVAVLTPLALAADRPDDRVGAIGVGGVTAVAETTFAPVGTADTVEARIRAGLDGFGSPVAAPRPDDRAGALGVGAAAATVRPDDRPGAIGVGATVTPAPTQVVSSTGTDWTDPLRIGSIAAALALLAAVVVYGVEHGRRSGGGGTGHRPAATH